MVSQFDVCRWRKIKVNANESKRLGFERDESDCKISLHKEDLEVTDEFRYLGVNFSRDGRGKAKVESRVILG